MTLQFFSNGVDTVIAKSEQDAAAVFEETTGEKWEWYEDEYSKFEVIEKKPDEIIRVTWIDDIPADSSVPPGGAIVQPENEEGYYHVEATAQQWIDHNGRCYFSTTDW